MIAGLMISRVKPETGASHQDKIKEGWAGSAHNLPNRRQLRVFLSHN